jgi:hypothetical protein
MQFQEIWQQYDFTEAELLSMTWQPPNDYILNLNYYWELNSTGTEAEVATVDQPLKLLLRSCIRLDVQLNPHPDRHSLSPTNLGTIVGWRQITPSPWIQNLGLPPENWFHLEFDIGGDNKIEALCRSLAVEQLTPQPMALSS